MTRMQIQLSEEQLGDLRRMAEEMDCSMAEVVRRALLEMAAKRSQHKREIRRRAAAAVGMFNSGLGDLAERHDDYLDEIYGT